MTDLDSSERPYIQSLTIDAPGSASTGDVLRCISADILDPIADERIGVLTGWLGLRVGGAYSLAAAGDRLDADALALGAVADELYDTLYFEDVLFIQHLYIEPEHRGGRVTAHLIRDLCEIIRPEQLLVALIPEPLTAERSRLPAGPQRDTARARLVGAYEEQGFTQHASSTVWWLTDPA